MAEKKKKATKEIAEEAPKASKTKKVVKAKKKEEVAEAKEESKVEKPSKRAAKKVEKAEKAASEKPVVQKLPVTEAHAVSKNVRVTPRKVRLVIDLVRGKNVDDALGILSNVNRAASVPVAKTIKSAASNASNNFGLDWRKLYVAEIQATDGLKMKRYEPRAKGSSSPIIKRCSHIFVTVKERN